MCVRCIPQQNVNMLVSCMVPRLCCCRCDVLKGGTVYIQRGVWFPHHKSRVTLIDFFEILSTYVYIFFQLWLCKYLDISVTCVYVLSSNRAVVEGILPRAFPRCWPCRGQSCHSPKVPPGFLPGAAGIATLALVKASLHQSLSFILSSVS